MHVRFLKSKLHMATVTATHLYYTGSITIDQDLIDAVGLHEYEMVLIGNVATGQRAETYVIAGQRGSRAVELNGAMARLAQPGDRLIILASVFLQPGEIAVHHPRVAVLDKENRIVEPSNG